MIEELIKLPHLMEEMLKSSNQVAQIARKYLYARDFLYLGRGINYPIALEGALKLKEISYIHAEGYPAGEMKHGPIALIDREMPVVVLATKNEVYDKVVSNIEEVKAREGRLIALLSQSDQAILQKGGRCHLHSGNPCLPDADSPHHPPSASGLLHGRFQRAGCGSAKKSGEERHRRIEPINCQLPMLNDH